MSPRRPRLPRVAAAEPEAAVPAPERRPAPRPEPRPSAVVAEPAPPVLEPVEAAPAGRPDGPAVPEEPDGGEVIDLRRAQRRREEESARREEADRRAEERRAAAGQARLRLEDDRAEDRARAARAAEARRRAPLPEPVPARQITGRSLVVVAVLLIAAVLVAPTARLLLNQRLEIAATEQDIAEQERLHSDYEEQIRRWDAPQYVAQQARERLGLVMPGETLYTATHLPEEDPAAGGPDAGPEEEGVNARLPWVEGLWDTAVRTATE